MYWNVHALYTSKTWEKEATSKFPVAPPTAEAQNSSLPSQFTPKRQAPHRFTTPSRVGVAVPVVNPHNHFPSASTNFHPRLSKIDELCKALNMDFERSDIPLDGFDASVIKVPGRFRQKARRICKILAGSLASWLCPEDPTLVLQFLKRKDSSDSSSTDSESPSTVGEHKLKQNFLKFALNTHSSVSYVAQNYLRVALTEVLVIICLVCTLKIYAI